MTNDPLLTLEQQWRERAIDERNERTNEMRLAYDVCAAELAAVRAVLSSEAVNELVDAWWAGRLSTRRYPSELATGPMLQQACEDYINRRVVLSGEREMLHAIIADCNALIDPEAHPELNARIDAVLTPCDEAGRCVASAPPETAPSTT